MLNFVLGLLGLLALGYGLKKLKNKIVLPVIWEGVLILAIMIAVTIISSMTHFLWLNAVIKAIWSLLLLIYITAVFYSYCVFKDVNIKTMLNKKAPKWYNNIYDGDLTKQYILFKQLNLLLFLVSETIAFGNGFSEYGSFLMSVKSWFLIIAMTAWSLAIYLKNRRLIGLQSNPIKLMNSIFDSGTEFARRKRVLYLTYGTALSLLFLYSVIPGLFIDIATMF